MIPKLIKLAATAVDDDIMSMVSRERRLDLGKGVRLRVRGHNASLGEPIVRGKGLEQLHSSLEVVDGLLARLVVGIAGRVERAHASTVLVELVLPEALVVPLVILPVGLHVAESAWCAGVQEGSKVPVLPVLIAVLLPSSIAVVRPILVSMVSHRNQSLATGGKKLCHTKVRGSSKSPRVP